MSTVNSSTADGKDPDEYTADWWAGEIERQEKDLRDYFWQSGVKIQSKFLDTRDDPNTLMDQTPNEARRYNLFWTNTLILKSALYAKPPNPLVKRMHDDPNDPVARTAALILQRILNQDIEKQNSTVHTAFSQAVEDRLIPGLGQVWARMDVETESRTIPEVKHPETGEVLQEEQQYQAITKQDVSLDYVYWMDFLWSAARTWEEVWWVARRIWLKKKDFISRFGQQEWDDLQAYQKNNVTESGYPRGFAKGRVEIFEIWCDATMKVYFLHAGSKTFVEDPKDDPLQLDDFWPCPCPLLATHTTNNLAPRADYSMLQDQYQELDTLNDRISTLTRALRIVGMYDKTNTDLAQLLTGPEFQMISCDNFGALAEKGGIQGAVDWFPVQQIADVLDKLNNQRTLVVGQLYELTGISDIMRGASNPRDTLGAQQLKAQYSSVRLQLMQNDVARFVCEALKIKSEIICKHFDPAIIANMSAIQYSETAQDPQLLQAGIQMLKNFDSTTYRIDITEESLSMADYTAEREMRVAYITAVGQFLSQAAQMVAGMPTAMPYLIKMIQWVTASFRGSDDIETVLDQAAQMAMQQPPQPPGGAQQKPPQPSPQEQEGAKANAQIQIDNNKAQKDAMVKTMDANLELRNDLLTKRVEAQIDANSDIRNNAGQQPQ